MKKQPGKAEFEAISKYGQNAFKIDLQNNKALKEQFDAGVAAGTEVVFGWVEKVFMRDFQEKYPDLMKDLRDSLQNAYKEKRDIEEGKTKTVAESLPVISV